MSPKYIKNWFSNFLPFDEPMKYKGMYFSTPEAFYQSMKTQNKKLRKEISLMSAAESKKAGRALKVRDNWEEMKLAVMYHALKYKFRLDTTWGVKLLETGDEGIVEWNNWHDNIWGDCICLKCEDIVGTNHLGKLLMRIRTELKEKE